MFLQIFGISLKLEETTKQGGKIQSTCALTLLRKHFRYWECDDLRSTIEQAIYYFNNERPVRKLKGKPPVPYRTELVA
ncbi:IS3 family transposase [Hominenteromicrobium sp.]|uniref:IS3 family transposase n=1 Tax=Hominenteromicrobium sp. TaxID=3073581 RepID=UPI003A93EE0B